MVERRELGRTGLKVSVLGFGCGFVGGLIVRGTVQERERSVGRALELGVNYFDTAPLYGGGLSEENLGTALATVKSGAIIGTKVMINRSERANIAQTVQTSVEMSLRRLRQEQIDLLQLHNSVSNDDGDFSLTAEAVLDQVVPAFARMREQGKIRFVGFSGHGETMEILKVVDSNAFDTLQVVYNLLNPSASVALPAGFPGQDYSQVLQRMSAKGMGAVGIRALAGGALSGSEARHPVGIEIGKVEPLGSGANYATDVGRARRLMSLVEGGDAADLVEASLRYAISNRDLATVVIGFSSLDQLEQAAAIVGKGALSHAALERAAALQKNFVGEVR